MSDPAPVATALPGTKFFAPQARLVRQDGQPLTIGGQSVGQDLVSLTVTRPGNGVGQVELTLNNQRFGTPNPQTPPWKYNGLDQSEVSFGTRFRVDLRYGQDRWTPMMLARVTNVAFGFPSAAGASVTITGEDLLSLLKAKPNSPVLHFSIHEIDMVESEVAFSGCGLTVVPPEPRNLFSSPMGDVTHEPAQSYLQFIQSMAERMDYEVFVEFDDAGEPLPGDGATEVVPKFYFVPSRSAVLGDPIPLAWGLDIVEFKPTFKVWDMFTAARVAGNVPRGRGSITVDVPMADAIEGDLHTASGQPAPLSAIDVRHRAFETELTFLTNMVGDEIEANVSTINVTNIDEERAERQGLAALRKSAREFLTADITTIGYTRLRPGIHVNLTGFYAPFDGIYYVTQAVHTLSSTGYTTKISVRRPGMLDPSSYPGG